MVRSAASARPSSGRADELLRRRFAIVQVWRPIRHPVESFPLAICDARSISPDDFVVNERRYPNRIGQTYAITYNPEHHWYFLPRMRREEALGVQGLRLRQGLAVPGGRPIPPSTTRPRRRTHGRARASKSARWPFSEAGRSCRAPDVAAIAHID
jgi:hypothetical protein